MWLGLFCVSLIFVCLFLLKMILYFWLLFKGELEKVKLYEFEKFYFVLMGFFVGLRLILIFLLMIFENFGFIFFGKKNKEYKVNVFICVCNGN